MTVAPPLILASASPRRKELLESVGISCRVMPAEIDETVLATEQPTDYVCRMAQEKAQAVQAQLDDSLPVLAADTIVTQGGKVFTKPEHEADAKNIWNSLSDAEHTVMTAVCLSAHGKITTRISKTLVTMQPISDQQMQRYWLSGEPQDKAGAYAIQGLASAWVASIAGSYSNVVGLPLYEVNDLLGEINLNWL